MVCFSSLILHNQYVTESHLSHTDFHYSIVCNNKTFGTISMSINWDPVK